VWVVLTFHGRLAFLVRQVEMDLLQGFSGLFSYYTLAWGMDGGKRGREGMKDARTGIAEDKRCRPLGLHHWQMPVRVSIAAMGASFLDEPPRLPEGLFVLSTRNTGRVYMWNMKLYCTYKLPFTHSVLQQVTFPWRSDMTLRTTLPFRIMARRMGLERVART
jgi:hypothetical protein